MWYKVKDSWKLIISSLGLPSFKVVNNLLTGWNLLLVWIHKSLHEVLDYEETLELKDKRVLFSSDNGECHIQRWPYLDKLFFV